MWTSFGKFSYSIPEGDKSDFILQLKFNKIKFTMAAAFTIAMILMNFYLQIIGE